MSEKKTTGENVSNNIFEAYIRTGRIAVSDAIWAALRVLYQPWIAGKVFTSRSKSTDNILAEDPTDPIDEEARVAISEVLEKAAKTPRHPLSRGFLAHDEEVGFRPYDGIGGARSERIIVFVDPIDGTASAKRGLDGSTLISFFDREFGLCAAVIGDLFRKIIYWRKAGDTTRAMSIQHREDPASDFLTTVDKFLMPVGEPLEMAPSRQKKIKGSSLCIFMGNPDRISKAVQLGAPLWDEKYGIQEVFSFGGSLGSVRVGEGLWDASIEITKGFRPWDFLPGAFIAEGAGATILDLDGSPITFGPEVIKDEYIEAKFEGKSLENCRRKFVVAATRELAEEIVHVLSLQKKVVERENEKELQRKNI